MTRWSLKERRAYRGMQKVKRARKQARERAKDRRAYYQWKRSKTV